MLSNSSACIRLQTWRVWLQGHTLNFLKDALSTACWKLGEGSQQDEKWKISLKPITWKRRSNKSTSNGSFKIGRDNSDREQQEGWAYVETSVVRSLLTGCDFDAEPQNEGNQACGDERAA